MEKCWLVIEGTPLIMDDEGHFSVCLPLRLLLGFCEDFKKIIVNTRQELILIRSNTDINAVMNSDQEVTKVVLNKIIWKIPHISLSDAQKLQFLQYIERGRDLPIAFRSWELHVYPLLQQTMKHTWAVKAASQLEKPHFVIIGFQTARKGVIGKTMAEFDHINLRNMKLYLNSDVYPYDNLNINFAQKQSALLYEMFANFQTGHYYKDIAEPCIVPAEFRKKIPLIVIDCSYQVETVETIKTGSIDIRLEFETNQNVPDSTSAFCLILNDRLIKYNPLTSVVRII